MISREFVCSCFIRTQFHASFNQQKRLLFSQLKGAKKVRQAGSKGALEITGSHAGQDGSDIQLMIDPTIEHGVLPKTFY